MNVYFIRATGTNAVKIGVAHNVKTRLKQLQTANAIELVVEHKIMCSHGGHASLAEAYFHQLCAEHKLRGEWFDLTAKKLDSIILKEADYVSGGEFLSSAPSLMKAAREREEAKVARPNAKKQMSALERERERARKIAKENVERYWAEIKAKQVAQRNEKRRIANEKDETRKAKFAAARAVYNARFETPVANDQREQSDLAA